MNNIEVVIDAKVYEKIFHWIDKAQGEVSGLGIVQREGNLFLVTDAILLDQENTGASTDIDEKAIGKAMFEMRESEGTLSFWWHSHVNMDVFWSGTDIATIQQLGKHGWFLSTVFNKHREQKTAYYQGGKEGLPELFVDDIETSTQFLVDDETTEQWDEEFEQKCKSKVWSTPKTFPTYPGKVNRRKVKFNPNPLLDHYCDDFPDFTELSEEEKIELFMEYVDEHGVNPTDSDELQIYYEKVMREAV